MTPYILTVGHSCIDVVHSVKELPTAISKVSSNKFEIRLGGNAANAAAAIVELGSKADLCTVLGSKNDSFTNILIDILESKNIGLISKFIESESCPSSIVMVLENGERVLASYQPEAIVTEICEPTDITNYNLVLGDTNRLPIVTKVFELAKKAKIPTMLDIDKPIKNLFEGPKIDHVWFSRESWEQMGLTQDDFVSLQDHFGGIVGVTDGANPIVWIDNNKRLRFTKPQTVKAINTLGAGDVFKASLAINLCLGNPVEDAIQSACISASEHITNRPLTEIKGEKP